MNTSKSLFEQNNFLPLEKKNTERKRANNIVSAWLLVMMHVAGSALMTDATILPDNRI